MVIYKNARFEVNGVDLSPFLHDLALNYGADAIEVTAMGADTHIKKGGLYVWSVDVTFHQDETAGAVDATLFSIVGATSCIEVRPLNSCSTGINPRYFGVSVLTSYPPLGGAVGTLLDTKAHFDAGGSLGRSTTAT